ncbi:MAG: hypothetical protein PHE15_03410 [Dehalococcoidales bacterium]|nr:hypothetical protein [Dehalococcoidales bacterium]
MSICKSGIPLVVAVIGIVCIVAGTMFIMQANSKQQEIAGEIAPLTIEQVDAKYEAVKAAQITYATAEEPKIQAGQAAPSVMYDYLSAQRALLGLAKSNLDVVEFVRYIGILNIIIGVGFLFVFAGLCRRNQCNA